MYVPVFQVNKVLQVELSGVLSEIDGVHVLEETTATGKTEEKKGGNSFMMVRSGTTQSEESYCFKKNKCDVRNRCRRSRR